MARIRTIKPEFWHCSDLAGVSDKAKLLAIGLLNHSDDEGYFKAHSALIRAAIFPFTEGSLNIHTLFNELSNIGYIALFKAENSKDYGHVVNFLKHQKINRPSPSRIKDLKRFTEESLSTHCRKGKEQGKEQGTGKGGTEQIVAVIPDAVFQLPLNDKSDYSVVEDDFESWRELYPGVDVLQELRKMKGWLDSNPKRKKTSRGINNFITNWLSKEQDRGTQIVHSRRSNSSSPGLERLKELAQ